MDRTERLYLIDRLLKARGAMPLAALMEELGGSRATALRDLTYMLQPGMQCLRLVQ
jgi:predicted DNA-binding transcriptional regulator YafY